MKRAFLQGCLLLVGLSMTSFAWAGDRYCKATSSKLWSAKYSSPNSNCRCRRGTERRTFLYRSNSITATSGAVAKRQCRRAAEKKAKQKCLNGGVRNIVAWGARLVSYSLKWKGGIKYRGHCQIAYTCTWSQTKQSGLVHIATGSVTSSRTGTCTYKKHSFKYIDVCKRAWNRAKSQAKRKYGSRFRSIRKLKHAYKKAGLYRRCTVTYRVSFVSPKTVTKVRRYRCFGK